MLLWIILGLVVLFVVGIIIYYWNKIIGLTNKIENSWAQIDVQLKKRADLVPNLIETVKGYAKHEKEVFTMVTKARSAILGAQGVEQKAEANNMLTGALKSLFAVAEAYPDLKANEQFKLFQEQLEGIENKIAYARQFYNDSVLEFNNTIQMFPGRIFAGMMGKVKKPYFEVTEEEKKLPKVQFT
jgi:LemA protein